MNVWPVIHVLTSPMETGEQLAMRNAELAANHGCNGVFLISMDGEDEHVPALALKVKARFPDLKVGINLLSMGAEEALTLSISHGLDATWSDNPGINSQLATHEAIAVGGLLKQYPDHLFFGSVAFKYQPSEPDPAAAAQGASILGMIPTTSGVATGVAAPVSKLVAMREALTDSPLALASGLTPQNIRNYQGLISDALVSTGISATDHEFSEDLLAALMAQLRAPAMTEA